MLRTPYLGIEFSGFNPLMLILKPQSNGPLYCNTVMYTLAADGLLLHTQTNNKVCVCHFDDRRTQRHI